jgi:hypothetical protein
MRNQIASEIRKLTTSRSAFAMLGALVSVVALGAVAVVTDNGLANLREPLERQPFLHVAMSISPLFALLLGIRSFTDEFRHGTIVPTLLVTPRRGRVLGAKLVAVGMGGVAYALAAASVAIAVGVPLLAGRGIGLTWSAAAMAEVVGRVTLAALLWTTIGVGLGSAVRHQVAAIAGALVWLLAGEGILAGLLPGIARYLPGAAGWALVGVDAGDLLSPALGAAVLVGYALAAAGAGAALQRRDVT